LLLLAAEARSLAEQTTDEQARGTMLMTARGFEVLAKHAARVRALDLPMDEDAGPSPD